jgi:type VI protein secretion system component VasK
MNAQQQYLERCAELQDAYRHWLRRIVPMKSACRLIEAAIADVHDADDMYCFLQAYARSMVIQEKLSDVDALKRAISNMHSISMVGYSTVEEDRLCALIKECGLEN